MDEQRYREAERALWEWAGVQPTEQRVRLEPFGVTVRVQEAGEGPPVLFIHGGPNAGSTWVPLVGHMAGFRSIVLDRPGTGLSDPYPVDEQTLPAFADGLVASVLDAVSVDRAHVVGSSFGGFLALRSAAATPDRVSRMVQ